MIRISSSVGKCARNFPNDTRRVQALLNVYQRSLCLPSLEVNGCYSDGLERLILAFQTEYMGLAGTADSRVDPAGKTLRKLNQFLDSVFTPMSIIAPKKGSVTWESEGNEGGPYHTRKLHVPSSQSGLTIGRGYDCRRKSESKISKDLISSGVSAEKARILSKSHDLFGSTAENFIVENDLLDFQVSPEQQKALFEISYKDEADEVKRICAKADVVKLYGSTDWDKLNDSIKNITVDLKFRGDYTGPSRKVIQQSISDNDLDAFRKAIKKKDNWKNVPSDRFRRRSDFISKAE